MCSMISVIVASNGTLTPVKLPKLSQWSRKMSTRGKSSAWTRTFDLLPPQWTKITLIQCWRMSLTAVKNSIPNTFNISIDAYSVLMKTMSLCQIDDRDSDEIAEEIWWFVQLIWSIKKHRLFIYTIIGNSKRGRRKWRRMAITKSLINIDLNKIVKIRNYYVWQKIVDLLDQQASQKFNRENRRLTNQSRWCCL